MHQPRLDRLAGAAHAEALGPPRRVRVEVAGPRAGDHTAATAAQVERPHLWRARGVRGNDGESLAVGSRVEAADQLAPRAYGLELSRGRHGVHTGCARGIGEEEHAPLMPDQRRRGRDREEAGLRIDRVVREAPALARGEIEQVEVALPGVVLGRADERDLLLARRASRPPGDAADGDDIARESAHAPARDGHHAQLRAPGRAFVPPPRAVRGERKPLAVGRDGERAVLEVAAGQSPRAPAHRRYGEDLPPRAAAPADRVASVVDLVHLADARDGRLPLGGGGRGVGIDVARAVDRCAVRRPDELGDAAAQRGQRSRLAALRGQQPDLRRSFFLAAQERERAPVRRPAWRAVARPGGERPRRPAAKRHALDVRFACQRLAIDARDDVGDRPVAGADRRRAHRGHIEHEVAVERAGRWRCRWCWLGHWPSPRARRRPCYPARPPVAALTTAGRRWTVRAFARRRR